VAQLAGLALGISLEHLALARHVVDCQNILAHIGYIRDTSKVVPWP
jgi:heterodisulfide reductase subunit B